MSGRDDGRFVNGESERGTGREVRDKAREKENMVFGRKVDLA